MFSLHPGLQVPFGKTISDFMSAHFIMKETISLTLTCKAFVGEGAFWKISPGCGGKQARNPIAHWCCTKHKQMTEDPATGHSEAPPSDFHITLYGPQLSLIEF